MELPSSFKTKDNQALAGTRSGQTDLLASLTKRRGKVSITVWEPRVNDHFVLLCLFAAERLIMDQRTHALAETLWNYHLMKHQIAKADAILVLCSHDERVAERAAQLFHEGWAPLVIFSGGQGAITRSLWDEPEAERFARIAAGEGVPRESILIEAHSTNTGENIKFTKRLLAERGLDPQKFIVVQKPYMERRAFATFRQLWPEKD